VRPRNLASVIAAILVGAGLCGCGLPAEDSFEPITRDDGFGLSQTTSPSTTAAPTTTVDATTTTALATTSTLVAELVELYFITGRQLTGVATPLPLDPALGQVMAALLEGTPEGGLGTGLRSALPVGAEISVVSEAGIATVDLPATIFETLDPLDQRLMFGQIVLTLTDRPGVGPVVFTIAGEPTRVYRGDASLTEPGQSVSRDDYLVLLTGGAAAEPATTTTSTAPAP
jgi:spore germination protein GerM